MSHRTIKTTAAAIAAAAAMFLCAQSAHAQASNLSLTGAEYFAALGTSDMGYSSSGLAIRLGVDSAPIVPLGPVNIGATAFYTHTSSTYDYSYYYSCKWNYAAHIFSAGPTLNLPLSNTRLTFQGRLTGSYSILSASVDCGGANYTYAADSGSTFKIGFGGGVKYKLTDKITLRADWDDSAYSTFSVGVGIKF